MTASGPRLLHRACLLAALGLGLAAATAAADVPSPTPGGAPAWFDVAKVAAEAAPSDEDGEPVWEYQLVVTEEVLYLADGTPYKVWGFGGSVPGPLLVARENERIRVTLINETSTSHTIHSHGLYLPHRMDGVPHAEAMARAEEALALYARRRAQAEGRVEDAGSGRRSGGRRSGGRRSAGAPHDAHRSAMPAWTRPVAPGDSFTYDFIARPAGTHFYHCHMNTNEHMDRGMSGPLVVLPAEPEPPVDVDVVAILDEWDSDFASEGVPGDPRRRAAYNYFTINGRSFPHTEPLRLGLGEVARIRLVNAGALQHYMHLHGQHFLVTHRDGANLAEPIFLDTVEIAPGQRADILIYGSNPGRWPFHDHVTAHVTNAGAYPGGMLTQVQVGDEALPVGLESATAEGLERLRHQWREWARRAAHRAAGRAEGLDTAVDLEDP